MAPTVKNERAWSSGDVVRVVVVATLVVSALVGLWNASSVLLFVFLGILFGLALSSGVDRLAQWRIPRGVGAVLLLLAVLGVLAGMGALMAPTLAGQASDLRDRLPAATVKVQSWIRARVGSLNALTAPDGAQPGAQQPGAQQPGAQQPSAQQPSGAAPQPGGKRRGETTPSANAPSGGAGQAQLGAIAMRVFGFLGSTVEVIVDLLLVLFLAVYIATEPDLYHNGVMHLVPHRARRRIEEVLTATAAVLRRWLLTQLVAMITIGVVWAIALTVLHVKAALALATIAGILEFVPTIGPTIAAIPAVLSGVLDSPQKGLEVLLVYLAIQGLESNVVIPLLMKDQIDLPPALTIVVQILMSLAFGFIGLMVAVPLLAAILVTVKMLYVQDVIGDPVDLGRAAEEAAAG